jgi:hypothetical protein
VIEKWRNSNQCTGAPVITQLPNLNLQDSSTVELTHYSDCDCYVTSLGVEHPAEVLFYKIQGGGHTWPGVGPTGLGPINLDISASERIWEFFSRHELGSAAPEPLPGDFNDSGVVDAADYVFWRNNRGTPQDYQTWRANFGRRAASGSAYVAIPETGTCVLGVTATFSLLAVMRYRQPSPDPRQ